jgi:DNA-binding XRE family transcriptional regulator
MSRQRLPAAPASPEKDIGTGGSEPEQIAVVFGRRLRAARLAARLSRGAAARDAGITARHLARIESGASSPDLDLIARLARAVECKAYELFPG